MGFLVGLTTSSEALSHVRRSMDGLEGEILDCSLSEGEASFKGLSVVDGAPDLLCLGDFFLGDLRRPFGEAKAGLLLERLAAARERIFEDIRELTL